MTSFLRNGSLGRSSRRRGAIHRSTGSGWMRASRSVWLAKGSIHSDDPRGWFQWYCRYYQGRRMAAEAISQRDRTACRPPVLEGIFAEHQKRGATDFAEGREIRWRWTYRAPARGDRAVAPFFGAPQKYPSGRRPRRGGASSPRPVMKSIEAAGYKPGSEVYLALDCASTEYFKGASTTSPASRCPAPSPAASSR